MSLEIVLGNPPGDSHGVFSYIPSEISSEYYPLIRWIPSDISPGNLLKVSAEIYTRISYLCVSALLEGNDPIPVPVLFPI